MATIQQNKGSKRAAMHPYLRIEKWADGTCVLEKQSHSQPRQLRAFITG